MPTEIDEIVFGYETQLKNAEMENQRLNKILDSAKKEIARICAEHSRMQLELLRVQAENARLKAALFPPPMDYKKIGGFKVYQ